MIDRRMEELCGIIVNVINCKITPGCEITKKIFGFPPLKNWLFDLLSGFPNGSEESKP